LAADGSFVTAFNARLWMVSTDAMALNRFNTGIKIIKVLLQLWIKENH
jgi:hypothetical protein